MSSSDEDLQESVRILLHDELITHAEDYLLHLFKRRSLLWPNQKNSSEWLEFADWLGKKRYKEPENI